MNKLHTYFDFLKLAYDPENPASDSFGHMGIANPFQLEKYCIEKSGGKNIRIYVGKENLFMFEGDEKGVSVEGTTPLPITVKQFLFLLRA